MEGDSASSNQPARRGGATGLGWLLSVVVAILVAGVLQFAAAAKVDAGAKELRAFRTAHIEHDLGRRASDPVADYQWAIPPEAGEGGMPLLWAYALGEFLVVIGVLLFCRRVFVWPLVAMMFGGLLGYAVYRVTNNQPCGCFGVLWQPPKWFSITMDAAFILLALAVMAVRGVGKAGLLATLVLSLGTAGVGFWYAGTTDAQAAPAAVDEPDQPEPEREADPPANVAEQPAGDPQPDNTPAPTAEDRPSAADANVAQQVLDLGIMRDVADASVDDPATYVFIWDPTCDNCAIFKPVIDEDGRMLEENDDPMLRVRSLEKKVLAAEHGIPDYLWPRSPTIFVVQGGEVISAFGGDEILFPSDVVDKLYSGDELPSADGFFD